MSVLLDKLIYMIDNVSADDFQKFKNGLDALDMGGKLAAVEQKIGKGHSEYHYQVTIGKGEGAIFIGWQHNSSKPTQIHSEKFWSMKIECNPNKTLKEHEEAFRWAQRMFGERHKRITLLDLCHDVPIHTDNIFVLPKQGREENRFNGDRYYGHKANHAHLKVYDKKRERKQQAGIEIDGELARIEYTWKIKDGMPLNEFLDIKKDEIELATEYVIRNLAGVKLESVKPEIRACLIAIMFGQMQVKDFSRYTRPHIEKALEQCEELALGSLVQDSWKNIIGVVKRYTLDYDLNEIIA